MTNPTLDKLIWTFVYGGLITLCLGIFVQRTVFGLGLGFMVGGGLLAAAGVALLFARSRRGD